MSGCREREPTERKPRGQPTTSPKWLGPYSGYFAIPCVSVGTKKVTRQVLGEDHHGCKVRNASEGSKDAMATPGGRPGSNIRAETGGPRSGRCCGVGMRRNEKKMAEGRLDPGWKAPNPHRGWGKRAISG